MKSSVFIFLTFFAISSFAAVDCTVLVSSLGATFQPMTSKTTGANTFFKYADTEIIATVSAKKDLSGAFVMIESLTANPKQQVGVFAGKDQTGIINLNAQINGQTVIVECTSTP